MTDNLLFCLVQKPFYSQSNTEKIQSFKAFGYSEYVVSEKSLIFYPRPKGIEPTAYYNLDLD